MATKNYVQELVNIMEQLRSPEGCPWDLEQTHESLKQYLVEESAELLDAIEEKDDDAIADELGDVLLQVVFHCQIAREENRFSLQDVARRCGEKMIRRHPHVFGDSQVENAAGVLSQWETIKKTEKAGAKRTSVLGGVPRHLPALHRADKMQKKAAKVGFDWPTIDGVMAKIEEELAEVRQALREGNEEHVAEEIGDLLFAVVNLSRFQEHNAEELLHGTIRKFENRFLSMEAELTATNRKPEDCTLEELDTLWEKAKEAERLS